MKKIDSCLYFLRWSDNPNPQRCDYDYNKISVNMWINDRGVTMEQRKSAYIQYWIDLCPAEWQKQFVKKDK